MKHYSAEIDRLQNLVVGLENERRELKSWLDRWQGLLSPIRKLPDELLGEIFVHCARRSISIIETVDDNASSLSGQELSMVCSHWRAVATSNKALWSTFTILLRRDGQEGRKKPCKHSIRMLKCLLERSGNYPLEVTLRTQLFNPHPAYAAIFEHSSRLRALRMQCPSVIDENFALARGSLPLLEYLSLDCGSQFEYDPDDTRSDVFLDAPNLRSVDICTPGYELLELPWSQITRLGYTCGDPQHLLRDLLTCSRLAKDLILGSTLGDKFQPSSGAITLPQTFRSLSICGFVICRLPGIFESFTTTTMSSLSLQVPSIMTGAMRFAWPVKEFTSLMYRSPCVLTELVLEHVNTTTDDLSATLSLVPSLKKLVFHEIGPRLRNNYGTEEPVFTSRLLQEMTLHHATHTAPALVPQLNHLELKVRGKLFDDNRLVDMVKSRLWVYTSPRNPTLRFLCLHVWDRQLSQRAVQMLKGFGRSGLSVKVGGL